MKKLSSLIVCILFIAGTVSTTRAASLVDATEHVKAHWIIGNWSEKESNGTAVRVSLTTPEANSEGMICMDPGTESSATGDINESEPVGLVFVKRK